MPRQSLTTRWLRLMTTAAVGICLIIGVAIVTAVYTQNLSMIQHIPTLGMSLLSLLLGLFLGSFIFFFFAKSISNSVIKLADATVEIGKGNLNSTIDVASKDEIGVLAMSFSQMAKELKEFRDKQVLDKQFVDSIFRSMVDTLIVLNTDLTIERVNQSALRLLRYEEEELIGKPFGAIFADQTFQDLEIQDLLHNGFITGAEKTYLTKDKKEIPMSFSCSVMRHENGKILGVVCVATDLRERKWAEAERAKLIKEQVARAEAEASEKRYRALAEAIPQIVWTAQSDGQLDYYNQRWFEYTGLEPEASQGLNWQAIIHNDDLSRAMDHWAYALAKGESYEVECRLRRADGIYRWHLSRALPVRDQERTIIKWIGTYTDIDDQKQAEETLRAAKDELERRVEGRTKELSNANNVLKEQIIVRLKAEQALKESEERFKLAARATNDVIWDWDLTTNRMWWHESLKTAFGYSEAECGNDSVWWFEYMHPEDKERVSTEIYSSIGSNKEFWSSEYRFRRADSSYAYVFDRGFIVYDKDGMPLRMIGAMMDITERKQVEESLIRKTAELERSNTELEQFAYVASHDLQEPLRMVASYTQLLAHRYKGRLGSSADDFIAYAVDGATRMQQLINDLLEYSRVGRKTKEFMPIDCKRVYEQALANLHASIEETSAIITCDPLPIVMGDEVQLCRLFQNLIGNAIKYHAEEPPHIHVSAKLDNTEWIFSIRDNGIGIDSKHFDRVFIIFQRLHKKEEYTGTGIGLAICKKIVERHHGHIWIESTLGEGSTFFFTLPFANIRQTVVQELITYAN
jgi:PAS domain S-box-containing protein